MDKVIITAALVGAELTREQTPYLPLTPDEIAEAAELAVKAGAAVLHIHVRDDQGKPTNSAARFKEVLDKIRGRCRPCPILMVSTGGAVGDSFEGRAEPLKAGPEMASLNAGSVNFGEGVFANPLPFVEFLARREKEMGIKPEIEVYDLSHLETASQLIEKGIIERPARFQFVMGVKGGIAATEENLRLLVSRIYASERGSGLASPSERGPGGRDPLRRRRRGSVPPVMKDSTWTVAGIGRFEFPMAELALKLGGHIRVGLEDNIYLEKGVLAKGSHELVQKAVALASRYERKVATVEEARGILCLA